MSYVKEVLKNLLGCFLLHISLNWTLAKLCIYGFRLELHFHPIGLIIVVLAAWRVYTFWCIVFMVRMTSLPTNMNGLWIDRWYMRQDWIRPALAAVAITSLFYIENCQKIKDFTSAVDPWLERLSWTASFFYGEKAQKNTDCNKDRMVWTGGARHGLKLIYDRP